MVEAGWYWPTHVRSEKSKPVTRESRRGDFQTEIETLQFSSWTGKNYTKSIDFCILHSGHSIDVSESRGVFGLLYELNI